MRRCWTCNTEHDLDEPCGASMRAVSERAAGGSVSDLFMNAGSKLGPVFTATYDGEDSCCGEGIEEGDSIQADGEGGWIHQGCEKG